MKWQKRRQRWVESVDPDFAEALNSENTHGNSFDRKIQRKTKQFCSQVQQALNLALATCGTEREGGEIFVVEVLPAPDCGHLLAQIVTANYSVADALELLRREVPRLRSEVATAIARKRVPELAFAPALQIGGQDE